MGVKVYIQHVDSGLVLDIKESNTEPGAEVILYEYYATPNQHWELRDGFFVSEISGLVLDVDEAAGIIITSEQSGSPSQQWTVQEDGTIQNGTGKVLEVIVTGEGDDTTEKIVTSEKHGGPTQVFKQVPVEELE